MVVVLADKLKDPVPKCLVTALYGLLNEKSQQSYVFCIYCKVVYQDTRNPTLEEATEVATKKTFSRLASYQNSFQRWTEVP